MQSSPPLLPIGRVYSFDALRGIMMLLGLVIHSATTFSSLDYGPAWPIKNPVNSPGFALLVGFIHVFRMPVFFVAAGYFSALLFYKKGPTALIINRGRRILLPFLVAVLLLYPLVVLAFSFSANAFAGVDSPLTKALATVLSRGLLPRSVVHLWFLYYLLTYVVSGWLIASLFKTSWAFTRLVSTTIAYILHRFIWRLLAMAVLVFGCLLWMGSPFLKTSISWTPQPDVYAAYLVFFGTGWLIYRTNTLASLGVYSTGQLLLAITLFFVSALAPWPAASWTLLARMGLTAIDTCLFVFGFIAFFQQYFSSYSPRLSYLMESAYWIYIVHLPIAIFIPGLLANIPLPILVKFGLTLAVTTTVCLVSYHYLVRGTLLGQFLNGRVYQRPKAIHTPSVESSPNR